MIRVYSIEVEETYEEGDPLMERVIYFLDSAYNISEEEIKDAFSNKDFYELDCLWDAKTRTAKNIKELDTDYVFDKLMTDHTSSEWYYYHEIVRNPDKISIHRVGQHFLYKYLKQYINVLPELYAQFENVVKDMDNINDPYNLWNRGFQAGFRTASDIVKKNLKGVGMEVEENE